MFVVELQPVVTPAGHVRGPGTSTAGLSCSVNQMWAVSLPRYETVTSPLPPSWRWMLRFQEYVVGAWASGCCATNEPNRTKGALESKVPGNGFPPATVE